ncbi:TDP-N-acetylfucosamine:lipid II N-acetylfucosaminyltransferase [Knoellia sp. Soil729]|uniref:TDP-N-acetylfucosamine:lipid II N-acetylfucosaminyltransferase n=1 Tax=Knoellia sp. Soil729 TaxID=1736394 RepID=UPI0006FD4C12|nr:TDP-N-acetylfucosamine:lipid II N-acetylfucosaminyltransferase [Knoellia sp. Soil729]KRE43727.1 hypothetical protein ASG74_02485 [Knoellia sp. Soil729]
MRILHVGSSSPFVDFLVEYFERAAPGCNTVLRYPSPPQSSGAPQLAGAALQYAGSLGRIARAARQADVVVAHMLTLPTAVALLSARPRAFRVWSGWGADYYRTGPEAVSLLGPRTAEFVAELGLGAEPIGGSPVRWLTEGLLTRAAGRVDAFSAPVPEDAAVMRQRYPVLGGEYLQLNYADTGSFTRSTPVPATGDILLGNSAYPSNNHLEAIDVLSRLDLRDRRVFTPLAYGSATYRDAVVEHGRRVLGSAFDPLLAPLPLDQYVDRVSQCGVVMMNHHRQQGLGNVGIGLWAGAHVALSRHSPVRDFLVGHGLDVIDIESMTSLPEATVSGAALEHRREVMRGIWGRDVVLANVQKLLDVARARGAARAASPQSR